MFAHLPESKDPVASFARLVIQVGNVAVPVCSRGVVVIEKRCDRVELTCGCGKKAQVT